MKVYVITKAKSEDYHGRYDTTIEVHAVQENAQKRVDTLIEENNESDVDYWYTTYHVIEKIQSN